MNKMLCNLKDGDKFNGVLLITKIIDNRGDKTITYLRDQSMELKGIIKSKGLKLEIGDVINVKCKFSNPISINEWEKIVFKDVKKLLPHCKTPSEEVMGKLKELSKEEFKSKEAKLLDDYFFKNEMFLEKFREGIGGVSNHHAYIGGLAIHTLHVAELTKSLAYKYDIRFKEIAILGAKLHDIGKIYEMDYDGPFRYSIRGEIEGHIVIGVNMVEECFKENEGVFSEEFKERIKGIIVQHHGRLEFGSPVPPKTVEAQVVHFADYIDATMDKIRIVSKNTKEGEWTPNDKRLDNKLWM
ncbi:MAG: HD domain-containing protein [Clostridium sp.]